MKCFSLISAFASASSLVVVQQEKRMVSSPESRKATVITESHAFFRWLWHHSFFFFAQEAVSLVYSPALLQFCFFTFTRFSPTLSRDFLSFTRLARTNGSYRYRQAMYIAQKHKHAKRSTCKERLGVFRSKDVAVTLIHIEVEKNTIAQVKQRKLIFYEIHRLDFLKYIIASELPDYHSYLIGSTYPYFWILNDTRLSRQVQRTLRTQIQVEKKRAAITHLQMLFSTAKRSFQEEESLSWERALRANEELKRNQAFIFGTGSCLRKIDTQAETNYIATVIFSKRDDANTK